MVVVVELSWWWGGLPPSVCACPAAVLSQAELSAAARHRIPYLQMFQERLRQTTQVRQGPPTPESPSRMPQSPGARQPGMLPAMSPVPGDSFHPLTRPAGPPQQPGATPVQRSPVFPQQKSPRQGVPSPTAGQRPPFSPQNVHAGQRPGLRPSVPSAGQPITAGPGEKASVAPKQPGTLPQTQAGTTRSGPREKGTGEVGERAVEDHLDDLFGTVFKICITIYTMPLYSIIISLKDYLFMIFHIITWDHF